MDLRARASAHGPSMNAQADAPRQSEQQSQVYGVMMVARRGNHRGENLPWNGSHPRVMLALNTRRPSFSQCIPRMRRGAQTVAGPGLDTRPCYCPKRRPAWRWLKSRANPVSFP